MLLEEQNEELASGEDFSEDEGNGDSEEETLVDKREPYNDQNGLKSKLSQMRLELDWIESLDITVNTTEINLPGNKEDDNNKNKEVKDDFQREMLFYCQAQLAAKEAYSKLAELGIPTERPDDYFAEMVKSDAHMQKIRKKLLEQKDKMELSEKAKRQRHLKKVGKKIQQDVLQKRQKEKKKMLQEVDRMKKGKVEKLYGKDDDPFNVTNDLKSQQRGSKKRKRKDDKFGFGGKKRKIKKNSAESVADMTSFKSSINSNRKNTGSNFKRKGKPMNKNKKRGKR